MASEVVEQGVGVFAGSLSNMANLWWVFLLVFALAISGGLVYVILSAKNSNKKWNLEIRVRQEDTQNKKVYLDAFIIKARRITLSNGVKLILLDKPIMGKRLMPLLNYYTKPGVYDILLTADNRLFLLTGIDGIDKDRKRLRVGVRYPGIDQDLDDVNREFGQLNAQDTKKGFLEFMKYATFTIVAICLLVAVIVGGNYWVEGEKAKALITQEQLEIFQSFETVAMHNAEFSNAMVLLIPQLQALTGNNNLRQQIIIAKEEAAV